MSTKTKIKITSVYFTDTEDGSVTEHREVTYSDKRPVHCPLCARNGIAIPAKCPHSPKGVES